MAGSQREHDARLKARLRAQLLAEPRTFEFVQAVKLLEQTWGPFIPVGHAGPLEREGIRFVHDPSLTFAPSDITSLRENADGRAEVRATFLGLLGAVSPLPVHFTEDVIDSENADDPTLRAFYDILHQRLYALFYRVLLKYDFAGAARSDARDSFTRRAMAFVGVDAAAQPTEGLPATRLLALAPMLAMRTRSARSLVVYLEACFEGMPIDVEPFVERVVVLDEAQRNKLGRQNAGLGSTFTLGGRVLDRSGRFRTRLGPMDRDMFDALMPGGTQHDFLRGVLARYTGGTLESEVELVLAGGGPRFRIGDPKASKLGVTTTLGGVAEKPTRARFVLDDDPSKVHAQLITDDPSS